MFDRLWIIARNELAQSYATQGETGKCVGYFQDGAELVWKPSKGLLWPRMTTSIRAQCSSMINRLEVVARRDPDECHVLRRGLTKLLGKITAEAEKVRKSIKHIDACIALFDPNAKPPTTYHDGFIPRHTAPKGHLKRFVLTQLREASEPLSARQIADAWVIDQMIEGDTDTLRLMRKRIGISINTIKHDGLVVEAGMEGVCKLWTLKKGGQ